MPVSYTCPNPDCRAVLSTANPIPAGRRVKCPKCNEGFAPEPTEEPAASAPKPAAGGGTFAFVDEPVPAKPRPLPPELAKRGKGGKGGKPEKADKGKKDDPKAAARPSRFAEDEEDQESIKRGYGVVQATQEEIEQAEKNKPTFGSMETKHRKSARGPATALLVMPANLLTFSGLVTGVGGIAIVIIGLWPLVFNDASPGDEEIEDAIVTMLIGLMTFAWGAMICFGASRMSELSSYTWAMTGAVMGILPLLVGIYAVIMLQNPKVKAGFEENMGALDEDEDEGPDEADEEEVDDEDD